MGVASEYLNLMLSGLHLLLQTHTYYKAKYERALMSG
jgi:hypothetical protein